MDIRGYEALNELLRIGPYTVSRGRRVRDRQPVLLKTLASGPTRGSDVDVLQRELALFRDLAIPGVPRALELVRVGDLACLVLEDRGLEPLRSVWDAARPDLAACLHLTIQLCTILSQLHARGVTCCGVNPTNVLAGADFDDVQLLDFTLASRSAGEERAPAGAVSGEAATYASPEQTGRINRAIDYRSDFYSLGATVYELLTGRPPFSSEDPLELIHSHIAKTPVSPSALVPALPEQLSRIVLRLLAKAAEDRYQSAIGLKHDLEQCARQWGSERRIASFDLGVRDVSDRFLIPQKLYGRDDEVAELVRVFEETCEGGTALMLVSGYSGIGKTSLISELYKPIVAERGAFISGKFDQVVGSEPYGALIQAFRGLMWQWLADSEHRLARWRAALSDALGNNGGVLAEVIPEVDLILGKQQPPPPLDPAAAQNRFRYVFQCFVGALARKDHPLVLFLDDLQWVDPGTVDLLHELLTSPLVSHLFVIGAYRENEVDAQHLLTWATSRLEASMTRVRRVSLGPLALPDLVQFLCDTLHSDATSAHPLAQLILRKTDGNPFFVIQFLKTLHHEGLFAFDYERGRWSFRLDAIAAASITDNVADLMTRRIRALSAVAQDVVTMAACIGSTFERDTLLTASRQAPERAAAGLAEAVESGLIQAAAQASHGTPDRPSRETAYTFLHDRVQQAAYSLIPEDRRGSVHLDVGRLLLAECGADVPDDRVFEIVNHLNTGRALISDPIERTEVARLNLAAGRKAKSSAAWQAASGYLDAGIDLLSDDRWDSHYELMFSLHLEAAECHYLARRFDTAERYFEQLLARAVTPVDKAHVHRLRIVLYENLSHYRQAVSSGLEGLRLFGISLPEGAEGAQAALNLEIDAIERELGGRPIASLLDLPRMSDDDVRMVMRILTSLWSPAYIAGNQLLARLISATSVRLSLAHGNTEDSAYGYVTHAITIGPIRGDYRSAYEWGELALRVNERFDDATRRAKIHQQFHAHVKLWRRSFASCIPHAREARRSGLEAGDLNYAGYGAVTESWPAFLICNDLDRFVREYEPAAALLERLKLADFLAALRVMLNWARALQGRTAGRLSLSDADFDEDAFIARFEHEPFFRTFFYTARLHLCVLLGETERALDAARRAREGTLAGTIWPVLVDFWGGLALASAFSTAAEPDQARYWSELVDAQRSLEELADNCAENFRGFWLMLSAEMKRISSQPDAAVVLCDEAIAFARHTDNLQQEALANELCARTWLARGNESAAAPFVRDAHRAYAAWGASTKVAQLEERYAGLLATRAPGPGAEARQVTPASTRVESLSLDMGTVLKLARAIAVEIELDGLLRKLMTIALENAGAERGTFLQDENGALVVRAEAVADPEQVHLRPSTPWEQAEHLAHSVVRYVRRTGEDVVVGDAATDARFAGDPYISRNAAKSILCVPVGHQGRIGGVLYLENNLTTEAFTPGRTETMRVLAAQAAISLENARLYEDMRMEVERRTVAERGLRDALAELQALKNRLEAENVYLQEEIRTHHNFEEIVGNSPALLAALHRVERVAPTDSTVLILGETGSGKELFARAVHSRSLRSQRPLVKVNCGAIAPGLVESELFGHVKGAFTGAIDKRVGRFELASGGTILLDEVGELPLDAQVKLLRVLQEQEFEPVGSSRTVRVDVRVIAATNRNLEDAVREGRFRADLLYRLNVFPIAVPPLRERSGDVRLLIGFCVTGLARRLGKPIHGFSASSMERLIQYAWPGNVRELQNVVERAAILAQGPVLEIDGGMLGATTIHGRERTHAPEPATLDRVQREHILDVLKTTGGVVEGAKGAATILGIHPNTLRSRMKKLGISPPSRGGA